VGFCIKNWFKGFRLPKILEQKIERKKASPPAPKTEQDSTTTLLGLEDCEARDTQLDNESSFKFASQNMIIQHISSQ
jgi:hypothetical protein